MTSQVFNMDCMIGMAEYPDKYFDLAVVDPPYGIGASSVNFINGTSKTVKPYYKESCWDLNRPNSIYFEELKRISKEQIVWGGNYFADYLGAFRCFICWDKTIHGNSYADCELAWTSFDSVARYYRKNIAQVTIEGRFHPTQKPITLYSWIYDKFLPQGGKVLDTHLGSGSNRIAAHKAGNIDFIGYELDKDYFEAQEKRFKQFISQQVIQFA